MNHIPTPVRYKKYYSVDSFFIISAYSQIAIKPAEISFVRHQNQLIIEEEGNYYSALLQSVVFCSLSYKKKKVYCSTVMQACKVTNEKINDSKLGIHAHNAQLCQLLGVDGLVTVKVELPARLNKKNYSFIEGCLLKLIGSYYYTLDVGIYDATSGRDLWHLSLKEELSPSRGILQVVTRLKKECEQLPSGLSNIKNPCEKLGYSI